MWEGGRMGKAIRIGIIGDFEPVYHSHFATNAALYDAATKLKVPLELRWLPTPSFGRPGCEENPGALGRPYRLPRQSVQELQRNVARDRICANAKLAIRGNLRGLPIYSVRVCAQCFENRRCRHGREQIRIVALHSYAAFVRPAEPA